MSDPADPAVGGTGQGSTSAAGQPSAATPGGTAAAAVTVPPDLQKQFPEIVDLILHSESMNDEERQYWINILPVMTDDQRENLKGILVSEREQLTAIDAKYQREIDQLSTQEVVARMESDRRGKKQRRQTVEQQHETEERRAEEEILKAIEGNGPS